MGGEAVAVYGVGVCAGKDAGVVVVVCGVSGMCMWWW